MSLGACKSSVIGIKGIFAKVSLAFFAPILLLERGSAELGRGLEIRNMCCLSITGTFSKLSSASSASSSYNSTVGSLQVPSGAFKSLWEPFGALRSPREFSETFKNLQEPLVALSLALLSL